MMHESINCLVAPPRLVPTGPGDRRSGAHPSMQAGMSPTSCAAALISSGLSLTADIAATHAEVSTPELDLRPVKLAALLAKWARDSHPHPKVEAGSQEWCPGCARCQGQPALLQGVGGIRFRSEGGRTGQLVAAWHSALCLAPACSAHQGSWQIPWYCGYSCCGWQFL